MRLLDPSSSSVNDFAGLRCDEPNPLALFLFAKWLDLTDKVSDDLGMGYLDALKDLNHFGIGGPLQNAPFSSGFRERTPELSRRFSLFHLFIPAQRRVGPGVALSV